MVWSSASGRTDEMEAVPYHHKATAAAASSGGGALRIVTMPAAGSLEAALAGPATLGARAASPLDHPRSMDSSAEMAANAIFSALMGGNGGAPSAVAPSKFGTVWAEGQEAAQSLESNDEGEEEEEEDAEDEGEEEEEEDADEKAAPDGDE